MIVTTRSGVRLRVRVQPRAAQNRVVGPHGDAVKLQVTAPPVDDAANEAVVALLASWLEVPRRAVRIVAGHHAREKLVEVSCEDPAGFAKSIRDRMGR